MFPMKGWIALDIDGTITQEKYSVPQPVIDFLRQAVASGWSLAFATGRAFVFAVLALEKFDFPFVLLPQNGSIALQMPQREILFKKYLKASLISQLEVAFEGMETDFLVYSGYEKGDRCFFRPSRFSPEDLAYIEMMQEREKESWIPVDSFDEIQETPLIKCFGRLDVMKKIGDRLRKTSLFQVSLIRDPFHRSHYILLITDAKTSKGSSLKDVFQLLGRGNLVMGAGDDENDTSLLLAADVKIAMPHAPESLRKIADFIAPPVSEQGIIYALKVVMNHANH